MTSRWQFIFFSRPQPPAFNIILSVMFMHKRTFVPTPLFTLPHFPILRRFEHKFEFGNNLSKTFVKKPKPRCSIQVSTGGGGGIRTPVPVKANGFQVLDGKLCLFIPFDLQLSLLSFLHLADRFKAYFGLLLLHLSAFELYLAISIFSQIQTGFVEKLQNYIQVYSLCQHYYSCDRKRCFSPRFYFKATIPLSGRCKRRASYRNVAYRSSSRLQVIEGRNNQSAQSRAQIHNCEKERNRISKRGELK